jgi:hypothetical protein
VDGKEVVFKGGKRVLSNCLISALEARKCLRKRLAHIVETKKER